MALNVPVFKTRALSSLAFVLIMAAGLFINQWTFLLLFSIIHFGAWIEYQKIICLIDKEYQNINAFHKYGVMLAGWGFMLWMTNDLYSVGSFHLHEFGWWIVLLSVIILPICEVLLSKKHNFKLAAHSFFGLIYISLSLGLLISIRCGEPLNIAEYGPLITQSHQGLKLAIVVIVSMWGNDTFAYLVGSFIGKTPFSKISPKKTWEGTVGGIVLCVVGMGLLASNIYTEQFPTPAINWYFIATIGAITGTAGDLLESKLKRMANIKDSGNMLPGHGGFLDRFDSLLVATSFIWLFVKVFM